MNLNLWSICLFLALLVFVKLNDFLLLGVILKDIEELLLDAIISLKHVTLEFLMLGLGDC